MHDLNDLTYFVAVVHHGGFSAAARATGIEKTRLSRRIGGLERRLGVRLLQRNTRNIALTEAGERFFGQAACLVEQAQTAFDSISDLRKAPAGTVRLSCPQVMAQNTLVPILPAFLAHYPKVKLELHATDRRVDLLKERFDVALRAQVAIDDTSGLVARELGRVRRVLVASPALLERIGRPGTPAELAAMDTLVRPGDVHDGQGRWQLADGAGTSIQLTHNPRLISDDLQMQMAAAIQGIGVALMPEPVACAAIGRGELEIVLPSWSANGHIIHLLYPPPRGTLPSVRSLIDFLSTHLPQRYRTPCAA